MWLYLFCLLLKFYVILPHVQLKVVNIKLRLRHLSNCINSMLIIGLFEVLIANMMFICGAINIKINIT